MVKIYSLIRRHDRHALVSGRLEGLACLPLVDGVLAVHPGHTPVLAATTSVSTVLPGWYDMLSRPGTGGFNPFPHPVFHLYLNPDGCLAPADRQGSARNASLKSS